MATGNMPLHVGSYYHCVLRTDLLCHRSESELAINIRKATSVEETAPKRKQQVSPMYINWSLSADCMFLQCAQLHRLHMGSQVVPVILGWDEGVST